MSVSPIFIGGFRSGTTLLVNLLGLSAHITPWFETKALVEALRWMRVEAKPQCREFETPYCAPPQPAGFSPEAVAARMEADFRATAERMQGLQNSGKGGHERYPLGGDCIHYSLPEALAALDDWSRTSGSGSDSSALAAATGNLIRSLGSLQTAGKPTPLWINKTPEISRFAEQLRQALGGCKVVYMVRNGRDVVASALALGWGDMEQLAYNWQGLLQMTREAMLHHARDYLELRYEDLLADPRSQLNRVLAFCGLPEEGARLVNAYRQFPGSPPLTPGRGSSAVVLQEEQWQRFEAIAGELQRELGY